MPVFDPGEERLPNVGLVTFGDAETGEQIEIDTSKSSVRNAFAAQEEGRRKSFKLFRREESISCRWARTRISG